MRKHSTVLTHIFLQIHSKQRFGLKMYNMYIRSLLSKTCSSGIVFAKFNQIYPCTFKNLTIFNVFSYLRNVKRLGICLPRGRSRSIINIHEIVTSRWWIERCHRRRPSGVRVKRDTGHTSLSKALVMLSMTCFTNDIRTTNSIIIIIIIIILLSGMEVFLSGWLPHRGKAQMACKYCFPTRKMF